MGKKTKAFTNRGARALTIAVVVAGGVAVAGSPAHAVLPVPTIASVFVAGSTTNKVVTAGTTVVITGTGFAGMTDNAADSGCSNTPAAFPASGSSCSQVRFYGVGSNATLGYTLATRYNVLSDTTIVATVPTITVYDGTTQGSVAAGTGSVKVQVVNTMPTATASLISASTNGEIFYRKPLTATLAATNANPLGGGVVSVQVAGVASLNSTTFPQEKLAAYVYSTTGTSPQVAATSVALGDTNHVNVTIPPGAADGNAAGVMIVHDGIPGTADATHLKYPAVITNLQTCASDITSFVTTPGTTLPTCTGTANITASATSADIKISGKGLTGASLWDFTGTTGSSTPTCAILTDTLAYCHLASLTAPTAGVAAVSFTPADPDSGGPATAPTFVPTAASILIYNTLV